MSKKRKKIERRRQVQKARKGVRAKRRKTSSAPPPKAKQDSLSRRDIWLAVGIVGALVVVVVGLYYFLVARPRQRAQAKPESAQTLSWSQPPEMSIDLDKDYQAVLLTEKGVITIDLFEKETPKTVNNFVFLARQGFYNGTTFHRVIPGFVAQAGDPTGTGTGGPGYQFENEIVPSLHHDKAGVVSMANAGPDTNGSQFFITYGPLPYLDGDYTIFGQVIDGMDVVQALTPRDPDQDPNAPPGDKILTVEIIEQ